jgi:hypothetical protein
LPPKPTVTVIARRLPAALAGIRKVQLPLPLPFSSTPASLAVHLVVVGAARCPVERVTVGDTANGAPAIGTGGDERTVTALISAGTS